jgi:F0F1-type ATP synthase assembly protein I
LLPLRLPDARQVTQGPGDPLSKAFELVATPAIFGFLGFLLDRWLGLTPLFTATFTLFVLGYMIWRLCTDYRLEMERQDQDKPWTREYRRREVLDG